FGASLSQVLRASARAKKPLTVGVLLRLTASVCDALHYAHELADDNGESMGLVHRDVTPQNILIGFNGVPKLTDFGIAKATNRGWETQAGIVKGKFSYMSPEQALGKMVDRRSDIFGTGIVLWEALTGRDLFKGSTPMEVLTAIREQKIEPPSKVVPGLTPIVDPIVMRALDRNPKQRFESAAQMRDEIEELIQRAGVQIDSRAISQEFASIYGEDIGKRALSLRQAMMGNVDLESLAKALGGSVLNPKQLPMMQGGVNNRDPLGLFPMRQSPPEEEPRIVEGVEAVSAGFTAEYFEIVDDDEDLLDLSEDERFSGNEDSPEVPSHRFVTGWDDATSTSIPEDELLAMISEEDATIGFLPPRFARRFGQKLQAALDDDDGGSFDEDEHTVGVPDATLSRLRSISNDESISGIVPPSALKPLETHLAASGLGGASVGASDGIGTEPIPTGAFSAVPNHRPVPRAPSVLMEEEQARRQDRFEPRAPSWDMESERNAALTNGRRRIAPLPGKPISIQSRSGPENGADDDSATFRSERLSVPEAQNAAPPASTSRRPPPPPEASFGSYSFTRGSAGADPWADAPSTPILPAGSADGPVFSDKGKLSKSPTSGAHIPIDWEEPSPIPDDMPSRGDDPNLSIGASVRSESIVASSRSINSAPASAFEDLHGRAPARPKSSFQPSTPLLLALGIVLLGLGAALGILLGPRL
ncbi:MAG: protein kinase, partial [Myxococcota bacterium]